MDLRTERMTDGGAGFCSHKGFQPNYLFGLDDLCKKFIKKDHVLLEIGSHRGVSTELLSEYANHVHAVEVYPFPRLKKLVANKDNITLHKSLSQDFLKQNKLLFDIIYIDGDHSYVGTMKDIAFSLPFLKKDGILCGHDMIEGHQGVLRAVNDVFPKIKTGETILHRFSDSSWAIEERYI
jgi:hypothetical protein